MQPAKKTRFSSVLITGASKGIGEALALQLAGQDVTLYLISRNNELLQQVKSECEARGATAHFFACDVTDTEQMQAIIDAIPQLDLVIANAGISGGTAKGLEGAMQAAAIFKTNILGVSNTVEPAIAKMQAQGKGSIAIISSMAGFLPLPGSPSYSASKACVKHYALALRGLLSPKINVTAICPGFVKTNLTDQNNFKMPLIISKEKAAKIILNQLPNNPRIIAFPMTLKIMIYILNKLPYFLTEFLIKSLPKK